MNESRKTDTTYNSLKLLNIYRYTPERSLILAALMAANALVSAHATGIAVNPNSAAKTTKAIKLKSIDKKYQKLLVGEKNIASAMSVISHEQIKAASSAASIYSILKLTPSVNEYQQNIGPSMPTLTVRGVRMSQLAQTLDGIPMTSLLSGGEGALNSYGIGSLVSTGQVAGIHVYPGVAPPDRGGFATIGGTINYQTKQPTDKQYADLFTRIGSFSTDVYGVQLNSGIIPHSGGLKLLARYSQTETAGYIQHTPARYADFLFSAVKPYDYGLSKIFATLLYNRGNGYESDYGGYPVALQQKNGLYYNVPLSQTSTQQFNHYLTAIVGDRTYINRHVIASARVFYIHKSSKFEAQTNPAVIGFNYPYQNNYYTPIVYDGYLGGPGAAHHDFSYNPVQTFGSYISGEAAGINYTNSDTIGFAPKVNFFLPHNDISIGGLIAEETNHSSQYVYGTLNMPQINGYNAYEYGLRGHRAVYSGYLQDKINLLNDTLHIEPGVTLTGVSSSNYIPQNVYATPDHAYTLGNYDKTILPYLGVSYDATKNIIAYASYGKGARFAPVGDYTLGGTGSTTTAPGPETVNAYEAGLRYISKRLYVNFDGFLQDEHGAFSFVTLPAENLSLYSNVGKLQYKGLEASGKYLLTQHLTVAGSLSYTQASYKNSYFAADTASSVQYGYVLAGDPLADVPNWLGNLSLTYNRGNFTGQLLGSYTGTMIGTNAPPLPSAVSAASGIPDLAGWTTPDSAVRFGNYFIMNLSAAYKIPIHEDHLKWLKVTLNIDNLLNRHYYAHYDQIYKLLLAKPAPGASPFYVAYPGMPRFIELGLEGRFT